MSPSIGASFAFYVEHFGDMEALHQRGALPPKSVSVDDWKKVRAVISAAISQATRLLRELRPLLVKTLDSRRVNTFDQRTTLREQWVIRVELHDILNYVSWMRAGLAIDVRSDGDARLCLWLQPLEQPKVKQAKLVDALKGAGIRCACADVTRWSTGVVIVAEKPLVTGTTREECHGWVTENAKRAIVDQWAQLESIGKS